MVLGNTASHLIQSNFGQQQQIALTQAFCHTLKDSLKIQQK